MKLSLKPIWSEFKAFAFKGNMIDLAVAVVIGAAFSGVVNSLVKDIIMPSLSYVTTAASEVKKTAAEVTKEATSKIGLSGQSPQTQPAGAAQPAASPPPAAAAPSASPAAPSPDAEPMAVDFSWKIGRLQIGHFVAELINFMLIAFAVFLLMVKMVGSVARNVVRESEPSEPTTKECPECLSIIPYKARRCCHCTAVLPSNP